MFTVSNLVEFVQEHVGFKNPVLVSDTPTLNNNFGAGMTAIAAVASKYTSCIEVGRTPSFQEVEEFILAQAERFTAETMMEFNTRRINFSEDFMKLDVKDMVRIICHELVHVNQYAEGRMVDVCLTNTVTGEQSYYVLWTDTNGTKSVVQINKSATFKQYMDYPWEKEAHVMEHVLLQRVALSTANPILF